MYPEKPDASKCDEPDEKEVNHDPVPVFRRLALLAVLGLATARALAPRRAAPRLYERAFDKTCDEGQRLEIGTAGRCASGPISCRRFASRRASTCPPPTLPREGPSARRSPSPSRRPGRPSRCGPATPRRSGRSWDPATSPSRSTTTSSCRSRRRSLRATSSATFPWRVSGPPARSPTRTAACSSATAQARRRSRTPSAPWTSSATSAT